MMNNFELASKNFFRPEPKLEMNCPDRKSGTFNAVVKAKGLTIFYFHGKEIVNLELNCLCANCTINGLQPIFCMYCFAA